MTRADYKNATAVNVNVLHHTTMLALACGGEGERHFKNVVTRIKHLNVSRSPAADAGLLSTPCEE